MLSIFRSPSTPYILPFAVFVILTTIEAKLSTQYPHLYPILYAAKIFLTGIVLMVCKPDIGKTEDQSKKWLYWAIGIGVVTGLLWIPIDHFTPQLAFLGKRSAFDPFKVFPSDGARAAFLLIRFYGLVVIVPIVEELFYRGFLLRLVTNFDDFKSVPIGQFTMAALAVNVVFFALSHPEWLAAAIFAAAMCFLVRQTKTLRSAIFAHAIANLILGILILRFGLWTYW